MDVPESTFALVRSDEGKAIGLLADEINQFALVVEQFAKNGFYEGSAPTVAAHRGLFKAARRLRERIAELIPDD